MTSSFPWGDNDLHLFLNVVNGALLLQCEDSSMLRFCLSTLINAAIKFTDIFAIDGYGFSVQLINFLNMRCQL